MQTKLKPFVEVSPQGDYISLRSTGRVTASSKSERGVIAGFSFRSRSRLMKKIAQLKRHHLPVFVTLTYPSVFPKDFEEYKYHVHKFLVYLFREFPGAGVIWKLEFQDRGAAHFHLLIWGVPLDVLMNYVPGSWYKIAGGGDINHLYWHQGLLGNGNKHCVQAVRSWRGVKSYAAKYMGKLDERIENTGRFWGIRGKVPFSPLLQFSMSMSAALEFRRYVARHVGVRFYRFGFWTASYHPDYLRLINYVIEECKVHDDWCVGSGGFSALGGDNIDIVVPEYPPPVYELSIAFRYGSD